MNIVKKIAFISFGRWNNHEKSATQTAHEAFIQTIEMAVAAEELGVDGAYFRVHHFSNSFSSPLPLLAAIGAKTNKIEIGTSVIDLRYENPHHLAENVGATDLIMDGRLQLGLGRGAPWSAIEGWKHFGYAAEAGQNATDMTMERAEIFLDLLKGEKNIELENPFPEAASKHRLARVEPYSPTLLQRIWWASGSLSSAEWAAKHGLNLQSAGNAGGKSGNTIFPQRSPAGVANDAPQVNEKAASPQARFAGQAEHIKHYLNAWDKAGHTSKPRVAIIRELVPLDTDEEKKRFEEVTQQLQVLWPDHKKARGVFDGGYTGSTEQIIENMNNDEAVSLSETIMIPVANEIGLDFNLKLMEKVMKKIIPYVG